MPRRARPSESRRSSCRIGPEPAYCRNATSNLIFPIILHRRLIRAVMTNSYVCNPRTGCPWSMPLPLDPKPVLAAGRMSGMRFTLPTIVSMMVAILLTGCSLFPQGPDQAERNRWSRVIEKAIAALPGVADASHSFDYFPYGDNSYYLSKLDVRLDDEAAPAEAASVVRVMAAQQLPPQYHGESTLISIDRGTDSYFGDWRFGRNVDVEANGAFNWARLSAARTGARIHWSNSEFTATGDADGLTEMISVRAGSETEPRRATAAMRRIIEGFPELASNDWTVASVHSEKLTKSHSKLEPSLVHGDRRPRFPSESELELWERLLTDPPTPAIVEVSVIDPPDAAGRTMKVMVFPPDREEFSPAQARELAERHLPYLAGPGAVVDYDIVARHGPDLVVLVGGCPEPGRDISPESTPFARLYERC
ncbi:hypothetical protein ACFVAV_27680 [Nocardia sp. NPDC057663]|uniref:hypothetical protein n=1 Tax=Nocardia sp. NPDC057663 TaxID=3346201 RepID=UPI00366F74AA